MHLRPVCVWIGCYETYCINCRRYFGIERCERLIALRELERVMQELLVLCFIIHFLYGASKEAQTL